MIIQEPPRPQTNSALSSLWSRWLIGNYFALMVFMALRAALESFFSSLLLAILARALVAERARPPYMLRALMVENFTSSDLSSRASTKSGMMFSGSAAMAPSALAEE